MRKLSVVVAGVLILLCIFSSLASGVNEPMVVKRQLLVESAKVTDIGMAMAKEMLIRAFDENITEGDVARAAADAMVNSGSSEYIEAFGVIVASGEQSALPHGDSSDDNVNEILPGEIVVVDLGARYRGYCTDQTRTFFMGEPTDEMRDIYNIVLKAQTESMQAVRAGEMARDVDKVARDIIASYGYGENFTHGLGHGIGVYIHMPPILSPSSDGILFQSSDMAISIEPGIYLPGRFGIRIEDDVMVERTGYQLITHFPMGLEEAILHPAGYQNDTEDGNTGDLNFPDVNLDFIWWPIGIFLAVCIGFVVFKKYRSSKIV